MFNSGHSSGCTSKGVLKVLIAILLGFGSSVFLDFCISYLFPLSLPIAISSGFNLSLFFFLSLAWFLSLDVFDLFKGPLKNESATIQKLLLDTSILEDGRVVDLAKTGLLDNRLIVPTFLLKELKFLSETTDEITRLKAKKALDTLKKLETIPNLYLQYNETHSPETGELNDRVARLAKTLGVSLFAADVASHRQEADGVPCLSIEAIATALRPSIPKGETLNILIQRLGKEPKQGIGYLDDGTMVVVNGGGDFLRRTIRTQVLSHKYSSSGKIIFCNAMCNTTTTDSEDLNKSYAYDGFMKDEERV